MLKIKFKPAVILVVTLALFLLLTVFQQVAAAQSVSQLSAQISRLESNDSLLRSRLGQLEAQIAQIGRANGIRIPPPTQTSAAGGSALAADPMFNRLATLVIELREQINALEERVSALEPSASTPPRR